ncbi:MAG: PQQ-dependent sugar dehydrogenase [Spirochaetaceae bacterium]|nr:PQQ-dependent sugar dehydrogenase [Spirochaetaceae bacterium]
MNAQRAKALSVPRRSGVLAFLTAVLVALPLGILTAPAASAAVALDWEVRASGLAAPTHVTSARDGSGRLFIAEKAGLIRIYEDGTLLTRPFLDIRGQVRDDGEAGLLSIAFHPDYREHPFVWVAYTTNGNDVTVARFRARSYQADRLSTATQRRVITVPHPDEYANHFGGQLAFGTSGLLFMSTGDGGGGGDPLGNGQNRSTLQGKMLRIKVLGAKSACGRTYCVPQSNPFAGKAKAGRGEIWATGLRNAWRFSVDPDNGDLWVADVGQDMAEEINRIPAGAGGRNLGWSCREGLGAYDESRCRAGAAFQDPVAAYGRSFGTSITGGFVYRGSRYASLLAGRYVAGDFGSGRVFSLEGSALEAADQRLPGVTSFGEDGDRELWAVTYEGDLLEMRAS